MWRDVIHFCIPVLAQNSAFPRHNFSLEGLSALSCAMAGQTLLFLGVSGLLLGISYRPPSITVRLLIGIPCRPPSITVGPLPVSCCPPGPLPISAYPPSPPAVDMPIS